MESKELKDIIVDNLSRYSLEDFELMKSATKDQYLLLEGYFQECISRYNKLKDEMGGIDLSVKGLSKAVGIARSTIYKHDSLKAYVENRIKEIEMALINKTQP